MGEETKRDWIEVDDHKTYMENPTHCPYCGYTDIEGDCINIHDGKAWQRVSCCDCESVWWDNYKLVGFEMEVYGDEGETKESEG